MCYRDSVPALDLEGIHVACLCGDNGHGKSALLDSITWALWGQSRARTQDELVHQGLEDMAVDLEFSARSQRYRVSRKYARRGRQQGHAILELQVSSGNGFTPISGNTLRETQERIRDILHMDYDTFVNTAFLLQGKADMFTAATPAKRKEVLAEVLDLAYYETLEERAKDRSRGIQDDIRNVDSRIEVRRHDAARRPEYEEDLATVSADLEALESQREKAQTLHRLLAETVAALRVRARELEDLERRASNAQAEIDALGRRIESERGRVTEAEALVGREREILDGFERLVRIRSEVERLQAAALAASKLDQTITRIRAAIDVERARLTGNRERVSSRIADDLEPRASRIPGIEAELAGIADEQNALGILESEIERQKGEARRLDEARDALNRALEARSEIEGRKSQVEREIAVLQMQLTGQVESQAQRVADLRQAADAMGPAERQLQDVVEQESNLAAEAVEIDEQRRERESMDGQMAYLHQANEGLRASMEDSRRRFDILEEEEAQCPVCKRPLGPEGKQHLETEYKRQGQEQKRLYANNRAELRDLESRHKQISTQIRRWDTALSERTRRAAQQKADLESRLRDARKANKELATAKERQHELESSLNTENFAHDQWASLRLIEKELAAVEYDPERRGELERQLAELVEQIQSGQRELDGCRREFATRKAVLDAELDAANRASEEIVPQRRKLEELDRLVTSRAFAQEEREQLEALQDELDRLGYDAEEHRASQDAAKNLEPYDELSRRLGEAKTALPREREALASDSEMLDRRRTELQADLERCEDLRSEVAFMPARERELFDAETARDSLEKQVRRAAVERERLRQEIDRVDRIRDEIQRMETKRKELVDEKSIYDELAVAFGRNGIQALMIEHAIPQLQDDANELLGRLTENRMFLKLQVLEGRRSRGVPSEELDIRISDEVGTRSYEMFSGGEAFRINFALRIALSKLLARRSGAPLPILFIDEGFGSLDSVGQEHLKEAIQSVQSDFEKIIVITHVEQVKEAFPVRIEVSKTPAGSTFAVV